MDKAEFHKRASSYIKTIGPDQEKKLKEFLVCFLSIASADRRNFLLMFRDSTTKMRVLLP
jgi:hypothetical protein